MINQNIILAGTFTSSNGAHILRSIDFGKTWEDRGQLAGLTTIFDIKQLNDKLIVTLVGGIHPHILKSYDKGLNWIDLGQLSTNTSGFKLINLGGGISLFGTGPTTGNIIRTEDYWQTWTDIGQIGTLTSCYFIENLGNGIVIATGTNNVNIYRSIDWGKTFILVQTLAGTGIQAIKYIGNGCLLIGTTNTVAGTNDGIWLSQDYGKTFTLQATIAGTKTIAEFIKLSNNIVLAGTQTTGGFILMSNDNGLTWTNILMPTSLAFVKGFASNKNVCIFGYGGANFHIMRTNNYGYNWIDVFTTTTANAACSIYLKNGVFLIGSLTTGHIFRSEDNAQSFYDLGQLFSQSEINCFCSIN
jgi:hypothetical protein